MFVKLFLLFAIIPVVELALLIKVGSIIGVLYTVLLVIATAMLGAFLVRQEGFNIMLRFQKHMAEGVFPSEDILDGALVLVAGAVLITPGLITDLLGFMLVLPQTRSVIKAPIKGFIKNRMNRVTVINPPRGF